MRKQDLALKTWEKILKDFATEVHNKKYKRIDYRTAWSKIVKPIKSVHIEVLEPDISILIDGKTEIIFAINDGTLGEFLYNTFLFKEEKSMPPRDDNETLGRNTFASTLDDLIASFNVYNKATADCVITAGDIAKVYDGLQSNTTSQTFDWNSINNEIATRPTIDDVKKMIKEEITNNNNKEKKEMKGFNFDFGPCTGDQVRMSMYGLAVKNAAGTYVSYNPTSGDIIDVDILNFDGAKFMYKIPVAIKDIAVGDIIVHNRKPMFVIEVPSDNDNTITCVDVCAGEMKAIIPTTNMFGFNYVTKIVSFFSAVGDNAPTPDVPFGNMLPFMLMNEDETIDPMMMMFMMGGKMDMSNPMMMYFMLKDNSKESNLLPLMFMMHNQNK